MYLCDDLIARNLTIKDPNEVKFETKSNRSPSNLQNG